METDNINRTHEAAILKVIKDRKLMRFDHIFGHFAGCSRATAYNHGLDKLDSIKEALQQNRSKGVDYLLQKWIAGDNATLQIAAMRLICTPEEHQKLNQQYIDHSSKDGSMSTSLKSLSTEELEKRYTYSLSLEKKNENKSI